MLDAGVFGHVCDMQSMGHEVYAQTGVRLIARGWCRIVQFQLANAQTEDDI